MELCTGTDIFQEKIFCMHNLVFSVHNVVLDKKKLELFPLLRITFSNRLKTDVSFLWHAYVCLDQGLIT